MLSACIKSILNRQLVNPLIKLGNRSISFELSDFQLEFQQASRKFAREVVLPQAKQWDEENKYPADVHKQAWELGFYSIGIPEKYGGLGQGKSIF